jgi:hypothetical protein
VTKYCLLSGFLQCFVCFYFYFLFDVLFLLFDFCMKENLIPGRKRVLDDALFGFFHKEVIIYMFFDNTLLLISFYMFILIF